MTRRDFALIVFLSTAFTAGFGQGVGLMPASVPRGVYARVAVDRIYDQAVGIVGSADPATDAAPGTTPISDADKVVLQYLKVLLDDPAVAGIAATLSWDSISLENPGLDPRNPAAGAYQWNPVDDVFLAVDRWNRLHPKERPKTIQIIAVPGFNSPSWLWTDIQDRGCGANTPNCSASCDPLFMSPQPAGVDLSHCGFTTIFWRVEAEPQVQLPLPLPWNPVYKSDWRIFLETLNHRIKEEPSSWTFVSIEMAGPTASSTEMILPNDANQKPFESADGNLTLSPEIWPGVTTITGLDVATAWNMLMAGSEGAGAGFENSDAIFVQEWNDAIDMYGAIFSGITLSLTTSTDALPSFTLSAGAPTPTPATGFEADCDIPPHAMVCAAVTDVLQHFTDPLVGGENAKATQENGMTASRDGTDLGANAVKWLAATTGIVTPGLPIIPKYLRRVLGGLQFSTAFSITTLDKRLGNSDLQVEGCPTYPVLCTLPTLLTPASALENVLQLSFFPGTAIAPDYLESATVDYGKWEYTNAPMNFVQIYDVDFLYAKGLSGCLLLEDITGNPATGTPPDPSSCRATPGSSLADDASKTQDELTLANQQLLSIAEPAYLPPGPYF
jgi:hypothetical protein